MMGRLYQKTDLSFQKARFTSKNCWKKILLTQMAKCVRFDEGLNLAGTDYMYQVSIQLRTTIGAPVKRHSMAEWRFTGGPIVARYYLLIGYWQSFSSAFIIAAAHEI